MKLKHGEKTLDVVYTFNSFKYMEELDLGTLETLDKTPFKMIGIMHTMLLGGLNSHPRKIVTGEEVDEILEDVMENGDIVKLLEDLIGELEKSSFFKNLQKKAK